MPATSNIRSMTTKKRNEEFNLPSIKDNQGIKNLALAVIGQVIKDYSNNIDNKNQIFKEAESFFFGPGQWHDMRKMWFGVLEWDINYVQNRLRQNNFKYLNNKNYGVSPDEA